MYSLIEKNVRAYIFILVYLLRLFVPILIFKYPVFTVFMSVFLDIIDGDTSAAFLTKNQYQRMDKALDFWWLTVVMIWGFIHLPEYKWILLLLFVFRLVGVVIFTFTESRKTLFLFPNYFENLFFVLFAAKFSPSFNTFFENNKLGVILVAFLIKIFHEFWLHILKKSIIEDIFKLKRQWNDQ